MGDDKINNGLYLQRDLQFKDVLLEESSKGLIETGNGKANIQATV